MSIDETIFNKGKRLVLKSVEVFNIFKAFPTPRIERDLESIDRLAMIQTDKDIIEWVRERPNELFEIYCESYLAPEEKIQLVGEFGKKGVVINDTGVYVCGEHIYKSSPAQELEKQKRQEQEDNAYLTRERFRQLHQARQESGEPL